MNSDRYIKQCACLLLCALIAACSFKTIYNRLDYLIPEYVEGNVTLDEVLQRELEQSVQALLDWHRSTQLIKYAHWLQAIQESAGAQLTEKQVELRIREVDEFWFSLAARLNQEMASLLPQLDQQQRKELYDNIHRKNEAFREDYIELNEQERRQFYQERLLDTYENWIGDLTQDQTRLIAAAANKQVDTAELRLHRRLKWQHGIESILSKDIARQEKSRMLSEFMAEFVRILSPELEQKSKYNQRIFVDLTVGIAHSMTEKQVEHFVKKTDRYIRMFTELAENR